MLGQIYGVPCKANSQPWKLRDYLGAGFETHLYQVLSSLLVPYFKQGATITQTSSSRDDGKDIIVESPVELKSFMGFSFSLRGKEKIKIYLECKSSNFGNISFNQFAGNLSRVKDDNIDYYVLITNTSISPYSFYQFQTELKQKGIMFYLFDQLLLSRFLVTMDAKLGEYVPLEDPPVSNIEYQMLSTYRNGQPVFELFLLMRNYQDSAVNISLKINTDRNWNISQQSIQQAIEPYSASCIKLFIRREYYDGLNELLMAMEVQGKEIFTKIKGINWECNFTPPLCGITHRRIIDELTNLVSSSTSYQFSYLWGEAGVGKTRIMDELLSRIQRCGVETAVFRCMQGKQRLIQEIKEFLIKKNFLSADSQSTSLPDILSESGSNFQRCLLIIDDLHNADVGLIAEIKQAAQLKHSFPIILLVVGRNDFSAGDLEYYALVQWCVDVLADRGNILTGFNEDEAKDFIRLIIQDVPQFALEKIYDLSNRIPLFIVETIEYLLEMKLVHVINRSSVGIQNPESFSSKLYIPDKIEDIYAKRFQSLSQIQEGETLQNFLLACTLLGVSFQYEVAALFLDDPEAAVKELFRRRFLTYSTDGQLQFVHESLYLFLKQYTSSHEQLRRKSACMVYEVDGVFHKLPDFQKGRVSLWADRPAEAASYFQVMLEKISQLKNHSNINIDRDCYDYLEDMYECTSDPLLQEKIILCKLYIALHYYTPYIAIQKCQWAQNQINKSPSLKSRKDLTWMLKEHEAHSYLNAGQLKRADVILQELLAVTICTPDCVDNQTLFDLYDKLSNLNIKYNNPSVAEKYIQLAKRTASNLKDKKLEALAHITHAKLCFYRAPAQAQRYLHSADTCLQTDSTDRIGLHNRITQLILALSSPEINTVIIENLKREANCILSECIDRQFANSVIRANLLLGTLYFLSEATPPNAQLAVRYFNKGIDASLRFGIGTYIWQIYNQLALLSVRQKEPIDRTGRLFDTVFQQLRRQNLLYIGETSFCYGNLLALSNVAGFYAAHEFESAFYQKMNLVSYVEFTQACDYDCGKYECNYTCEHSTERLGKELARFRRMRGKRMPILFQKKIPSTPLWDKETGYYIILS